MSEDFYAVDTASTPRGDGIRDLTIPDRWDTATGRPNGGYLLAAMLRGLGDEIGEHDPLVASISFLAPPVHGDAEIRTSVVRAGRRVQTGQADLVSGGRTAATMVASFGGRVDSGDAYAGRTPPQLPPPDSLPDPRTLGLPDTGLLGRVDYRLAKQPGWVTGEPSGEPVHELWQRLRPDREIDFAALAFLTDSFAPAVMELGHGASATVQLTVHLLRRPVPGWIATRITTHHVADGFHDEDVELWDEDGHLVAQGRQLAILL